MSLKPLFPTQKYHNSTAKLFFVISLFVFLSLEINVAAFTQTHNQTNKGKKSLADSVPKRTKNRAKKQKTFQLDPQTKSFLLTKLAAKRAKQEKLKAKGLHRSDQPQEAIQFYLKKRLPEGATELPVEKYLEARETVRQMPFYSTAKGRFLSEDEKNTALSGGTNAENAENLDAWTPLGPGNIGGRTRALLIDPNNPQIMYAGGAAGGVWKTTSGGSSWSPLTDTLSNLAVNSLAMDSNNSNVIYAGTGEGYFNTDSVRGAGIFKTSNGGATWTALFQTTGNSNFHYVNDIAVSRVNSQNVYAATNTGVWRSLDGGSSWTQVLNAFQFGGCLDLAIRTDQAAADYIFASCGTFSQATIYRNTNAAGGGTWTTSYTESGMQRTSLAIAPSNQNVIYAMAANDSSALHKILRSVDGGATWSTRVDSSNPTLLNRIQLTNPVYANYDACFGTTGNTAMHNQGWYDNVIAVDPLDSNRIWTGGVDLFRSDDGGANWGLASHWWAGNSNQRYSHADQHVIVFHPQYNGTTNQTMFVGNDGGIFRTANARAATANGPTAMCSTNNGSVFWTPLNNGYAVTQFYHGLPYPNGTTYFGGTQDNGTVRGSDSSGANAWNTLVGGDGGYVAVDRTNTNILYAETQNTSIVKSTDGGTTFNAARNGISGSGLFITPFVMDGSNTQRLWTGTNVIYRTTNGAGNWVQASSSFGSNVSAIAVSPQNGNVILAGTESGSIRRTSTGLTDTSGSVWASTAPRSGAYVSSLAYDPNNSNIAYATYSNFGGTKVFRSTNGGTTWTGIDGTGAGALPDVPVHSIVIDPSNSSRLYIGTDTGVFTSSNAGASWAPENTGFPNTVVEWLTINTVGTSSTLFAFTHGRGVFKVNLNQSSAGVFQFSSAAYEVNENGGTAVITVQRTNGTDPANVNYATSNGTAIAGADYNGTSGPLTFGAGETSKTFTVSIIDDTLVEGNETVNLTLSNPTNGATIGTVGSAVLTIIDNDSACSFSPPTPDSSSFLAAGGNGSFQVNTQSGCPWTVTVDAPLAENSQPQSVSNPAPITINDRASNSGAPGTGSLYPSSINIGGTSGAITNVKVILNGLSHTYPDDIDILLVGPGGQRALLMSDAGGSGALTGVNLTFEQNGSALPDASQIASGVYRPSNYAGNSTLEPNGADTFPAPAPGQANYATDLSVFNGTTANGNWQLFVVDDENVDSGAITGGWTLDVTTGSTGGSWITITSGSSGSGPGAVNYRVSPNQNAGIRNGTITVGGRAHRVSQAGTINRPPTRFDYDGDGKTDVSIFRPSNQQWWINKSNGGVTALTFGLSNMKLVPADYTGDGKTDIAFYRQNTAEWYVIRSENSTFYAFPFGSPGDTPVPADYDGDRKADVAVFNNNNGQWWILGSSAGLLPVQQFGIPGDKPIPADYDGDGKTDVAIFRPAVGEWWLKRSASGVIAFTFGGATDRPVQGDFTGDGKDDVAFWRNSTREWFIVRSQDHSYFAFPFGSPGDTPVSGDYDGDGITDAAVFNNNNLQWWIRASRDPQPVITWGALGDIPTASAFVP